MVSVPRQSSNSRDPTSAVFGGSTVFKCCYAKYSGNESILDFVRNLKLAHIIVDTVFWGTVEYIMYSTVPQKTWSLVFIAACSVSCLLYLVNNVVLYHHNIV